MNEKKPFDPDLTDPNIDLGLPVSKGDHSHEDGHPLESLVETDELIRKFNADAEGKRYEYDGKVLTKVQLNYDLTGTALNEKGISVHLSRSMMEKFLRSLAKQAPK